LFFIAFGAFGNFISSRVPPPDRAAEPLRWGKYVVAKGVDPWFWRVGLVFVVIGVVGIILQRLF